jgi:hypothetical protein
MSGPSATGIGRAAVQHRHVVAVVGQDVGAGGADDPGATHATRADQRHACPPMPLVHR